MNDRPSPDGRRSIELEIEVPGTPEAVWQAIATGPGVTSWYVPHRTDEREGGAAIASFGPGPEMQAPGRVAAWDPPRRFVIDGGEDADGLAFEWLVEARDGGSCIVRLVNSGFLVGEEWDDYYDGMTEGWAIFLTNLRLHLEHFPGRHATASLPMASWAGPTAEAWTRLTQRLGIDEHPAVGTRIRTTGDDVPVLTGTVVEATANRLSLLVETPAPGTAFIAAEGRGTGTEVSVWTYLYGPEGAEAAERDEPRWRACLDREAATPG